MPEQRKETGMTFKVHTIEDAPGEAKPLLKEVRERFGFLPNQMGVLALSPLALGAYVTLDRLFAKTSFSETERNVILLAISRENNCEYCTSGHSKAAQAANVPADVIKALRAGEPVADTRLEALRGYAISLMRNRGTPAREAKQAFLDAGYSPRQALEILLAISMKTLANYANNLAHTPLDEAFQETAWERKRAAS